MCVCSVRGEKGAALWIRVLITKCVFVCSPVRGEKGAAVWIRIPCNNQHCLLAGVLEEARFFGIDSLIEHLEIAIKVPCCL